MVGTKPVMPQKIFTMNFLRCFESAWLTKSLVHSSGLCFSKGTLSHRAGDQTTENMCQRSGEEFEVNVLMESFVASSNIEECFENICNYLRAYQQEFCL